MIDPRADDLRAERLIRIAAGRTNLLIAGSPVTVLGENSLAGTLRQRLAGFGALPAEAGPSRFVFVIEATQHAFAELLSGFPAAGSVPTVVVLASELAVPATQALADAGWALETARPGATLATGESGVIAVVPETTLPAGAGTGSGAERIAWARRFMPITTELAAELGREGLVTGRRIGVSLVLEPKTCVLALALAEAGAEVAVFAPVSETDTPAAAALTATGVTVFAPTSVGLGAEAQSLDARHAAALLDWAPELLIDDGSHLIRLAHTERPAALEQLLGAGEETTSGVRPLVELAAEDGLRIPVIGVNDARTKTLFDNRIGTGQSCVLAIADLLDPETEPSDRAIAGTDWLVIGYGPVGEGVARHARALGARVRVHDRDPVRELAARHDGYPTLALNEGIAQSGVVVSATGVWHTVTETGFLAARPDTVFAVAGGIDDELGLDELRARGWVSTPLRDGVDRWSAQGAATGALVLASGGGVNYTAGEGNPIEIMDLSFATQLAALRQILETRPAPGLVPLRPEAEAEVAMIALGGAASTPTPGAVRPGGAAQHWSVHRYRQSPAENLEE